MQKDAGLFLQQHGASRAAINSGRVLGYSTCPRDIDGQRKRLIQNYPSVLGSHIMNAIQVINSQTSVILTNHSFISPDRMCILRLPYVVKCIFKHLVILLLLLLLLLLLWLLLLLLLLLYSNATSLLSADTFFVCQYCDKLIFITIIISVGRALDD